MHLLWRGLCILAPSFNDVYKSRFVFSSAVFDKFPLFSLKTLFEEWMEFKTLYLLKKIVNPVFSLTFLSSQSFVKSRRLWDPINIISLTYLDS